MKLVVMTCVEEHVEVARKLLKKSQVVAFNESEMKRFRMYDENDNDNWFAAKHYLDSAHIFFSICDNKKAKEIINEVKKCKIDNNIVNANAFILNIENAA